jgi:outer membrane protein OmpA-like peptidoglycan-associated protein
MRRQVWALVLAAGLIFQGGCSATKWNKPIGKGTYIPAAICAALGAGAGAGIYLWQRDPGQSCVQIDNDRVCVEDDLNEGELAGSAAIGLVAGALLCGIAGHVFLDPDTTATPTPEPTPLPPPAVEGPPPGPPVVRKRIVLRGITFDFDQSVVRDESRPVLDEARDTLRANPDVQVAVEGHTDALGTDEYNQALSIRRAEAVYRYLVNAGIAPERLKIVGQGESQPVADNESETGRAQNRRVELKVEP